MQAIRFGALRPAQFYLEVERDGRKQENPYAVNGLSPRMVDSFNALLCEHRDGQTPFTERGRLSLQDRDFQERPQLTFTLIDGKPVLATGQDALNVGFYRARRSFGSFMGTRNLPEGIANATEPDPDQVQEKNPVQVKLRVADNDQDWNNADWGPFDTSLRIVDIIG